MSSAVASSPLSAATSPLSSAASSPLSAASSSSAGHKTAGGSKAPTLSAVIGSAVSHKHPVHNDADSMKARPAQFTQLVWSVSAGTPQPAFGRSVGGAPASGSDSASPPASAEPSGSGLGSGSGHRGLLRIARATSAAGSAQVAMSAASPAGSSCASISRLGGKWFPCATSGAGVT